MGSTVATTVVRLGLIWILLSNAVDLGLTLWGVSNGIIEEANPLMAPLLSANPTALAGLKLMIVGAGVAALAWAYPRRPRFTLGAVAFLSLVMLGVMGMHATWVLS